MKKANPIIAILAFTACLHNFTFAQKSSEQILRQRIAEKNIPGLAYLVAQHGQIVEEGYYGLSNLELQTPVSASSVFAIASMSKTYTAAAILLLAEEGGLSLDDPVKQYIPEAPDSWEGMTINHLLTHTSGLVDDWALYDWDGSNELFLKSQTDSAFLHHLFRQELRFPPGTSQSYSCGPFVLGVVMERITGQYYEEYLKRKIFEPLDLRETYVDHPYKIIPQRVAGYFLHDTTQMQTGFSGQGNGIIMAPPAYGRADVGIRTTARDLMKFYNALLSGKLLSERSRKMMFSPATLSNGEFIPSSPGWMIWPLSGHLIAEHSGIFRTGFSSQALLIPEEEFMVIVLTNLHGGINFTMVQKIAANYFPELLPLSGRTPETDTKPGVTAQHLTLLKNLATGDIDKTAINEHFPLSYYSNAIKRALSSLESIVFLGEEEVSGRAVELFGESIHTLRHYKLMAKRELFTTVSLDREGKVVFVDYPETE